MKVLGKKAASRRHADADTMRLIRLVEAQRHADVERVARDWLARNERHPLALKALSFALVGLRRFEEVVSVTDFALRVVAPDGEIHNNRAIALAELMRWEEAIPEFKAALELLPADHEIHKNLGTAYVRLHRWNDAVPSLLKAIELHPGDYVEAIELLGRTLHYARRLDEALVVCRSLHHEFPTNPVFLHRLINAELYLADWGKTNERLAALARLPGLAGCTANSWDFFKYWGFSMRDYQGLASRFAASMIPARVLASEDIPPMTWRPGQRKLRLGYLSSDLAEHPVGFVIAEVIERHRRDRVTVFAYSIGADDNSSQRKRLVASFDHFVDVGSLSVQATADRIRADEIDILIDLNGWTGNSRAEALALRCAPVQVSWLGFAGTLGHPRLADYVLGDAEVTPLADQPWFTEHIVQMPYSYMPADTVNPLGEAPSRQSQGLPEAGFVLCSFNNAYKFNPPVFDLWCAMLRQMPDAVLWLSKYNDTITKNLRQEATARGVPPERLIFAERLADRSEYLARLQLADLALDPFPYNSHSTGVDALLAGVPMVTKRGSGFPGRVGASLLLAAGLPELVADDDEGYLRTVLELHGGRERLAAIRHRLSVARSGESKSPLFDMPRFVADLEERFFAMARHALDLSEGRPLSASAAH